MSRQDIRRLRGALTLTQEQFGKLVHAHAGTVSRWENGAKEPDEWQVEIMESLWQTAFKEPERADLAKEKLALGLVALALGILLGAALGGGK